MPQIEAPRTFEKRAGIATAVAFSLAAVGAGGARAQEENINPDTAVLLQPDCIPASEVGTIPGTGPTELLSNGDSVLFPEASPLPGEETTDEQIAQLSGELPVTDETLPEESTTDNSTTQEVDVNPDELLTEGEEAVIDCPPGTIPNPNLTSNESTAEFLTPRELLENSMHQEESEIKNISYGKVVKTINELWDNYGVEIGTYSYYYDQSDLIEKKEFNHALDVLKNGHEGNKKLGQEVVNISRAGMVVAIAAVLAGIDAQTENPSLKHDIEKAIDLVIDHGLIGLTNNRSEEKRLRQQITSEMKLAISRSPYFN